MTFFMAMADLALHSPIVTADFVRREAARLQVTTVTLRNVLRRAECGGWTQKADRLLVMPPRCKSMSGASSARWFFALRRFSTRPMQRSPRRTAPPSVAKVWRDSHDGAGGGADPARRFCQRSR